MEFKVSSRSRQAAASATTATSGTSYITMYEDAPVEEEIALEEFEDFALDRLRGNKQYKRKNFQ